MKALYKKIYNRIERNGNNIMEKGEFYNYLKVILAFNFEDYLENEKELPEELEEINIAATYSHYVFNAIDIKGKGYLTFEDSYEYVKGIKEKDNLTLIKLSFRAIDKDRSRTVESKEVKEALGIFGCTLNEKRFLDFLKEKTKSTKLSFPQYYEAITGEELEDKEVDPYDGLIKGKPDQSSCCILI